MQDCSTLILHPEIDGEPEIPLHISMEEAGIPRTLQPGLVRYFLQGIRPGDFLQAVLKNDLRGAVVRASDPSSLGPLVLWLNTCVPHPSWGSPQAVERWITYKTVGGIEL